MTFPSGKGEGTQITKISYIYYYETFGHIKINKLLQSMPEDNLKQVLKYLEEIRDKSSSKIDLSHNLNKIIEEDRNLLKRLAE